MQIYKARMIIQSRADPRLVIVSSAEISTIGLFKTRVEESEVRLRASLENFTGCYKLQRSGACIASRTR